MGVYKSDKVWVDHTDSEKKVIIGSFPNHKFLTKEEHAKRVHIEEQILGSIVSDSRFPEQSGLFSGDNFIVFWEDENPKAFKLDSRLLESLGVIQTNETIECDTGNAMAGIASWLHTIYFKLK